MESNTYTYESVTNMDGSLPEMMPFTVTWEEIDYNQLLVTAPEGSEWTVNIHRHDEADSPRNFDRNTTFIYAWTSSYGGGTDVLLDELERGITDRGDLDDAADALLRWIGEFGAGDFERIERHFTKWVAITGSKYRIQEKWCQGYTQSDWSRWIVLFDSTEDEKSVCGELDVYYDYMVGDVFGYEIEETGDSCYGFYGDDWAKNGAMDYIAGEIRGTILEQKRSEEQAAAERKRAAEEKAAAAAKARAAARRMLAHWGRLHRSA